MYSSVLSLVAYYENSLMVATFLHGLVAIINVDQWCQNR